MNFFRTFGCREQRTTELHDRFFAFSETAIAPLPVLKSEQGRLERVLKKFTQFLLAAQQRLAEPDNITVQEPIQERQDQ